MPHPFYDSEKYDQIKERWLSARHVGSAKPVMRAYVRVTKLIRNYHRVGQEHAHAHIPGLPKGLGPNWIWQGRWIPKTGWQRLPNVVNFHGEQGFDSNGVQTATITIENVGMTETTGVAGVYRVLNRGHYAPFYGHKPSARPAAGTKNEWFDMLNDKSCEIMVVAGYGDVAFPVFNGLVNDLEVTSRPARLTITARDVGQLLTDQQCFGNAKVQHVPDPITFADRRGADEITREGSGANASTSSTGHGPGRVLDGNDNTFWRTRDYQTATPAELPFIQINVPHGRYETIRLQPRYAGLKCYICVRGKAKNAPGGTGVRRAREGSFYGDGDWIDTGQGHVPGTTIPYTRVIEKVETGGTAFNIDKFGFLLGDDSIIRLYFTNLKEGKSNTGKGRAYHAGVIHFLGVRRVVKDEARQQDWILVDDLSDVVKTVFQWAGINDFEVERTGVRLKENATFNRGNYLIDIINAACEQTGYVFFIKPPYEFDESPEALAKVEPYFSMGLGVFRSPQALRVQSATIEPVEEVREDRTLTGVQARFTDEPLSFNIRVRGAKKAKKKGGRTLGGDDTPRYMYVYRPPWSRGAAVTNLYGGKNPSREVSATPDWRNGNVKRYTVHHDPKLESLEECKIAAIMIAFQQALESAQATLEFPAFPPLNLDQQLAVFDIGTGLSTRVWIATRQIEFEHGENGHFVMSVGGSLLDLPDISIIRDELNQALSNSNFHPGISQWERENFAHVYRNVR
jgi:hypothetical protein